MKNLLKSTVAVAVSLSGFSFMEVQRIQEASGSMVCCVAMETGEA